MASNAATAGPYADASACAIAATLHTATAIANPIARADAIDEAAREQQADRIGELETEDDVGVVDLAPAEFLLQRRLEQADHLAIDVVDRRREEQQQADHPAIPPDARSGRSDRRGRGDRRGGDAWLAVRWLQRSVVMA